MISCVGVMLLSLNNDREGRLRTRHACRTQKTRGKKNFRTVISVTFVTLRVPTQRPASFSIGLIHTLRHRYELANTKNERQNFHPSFLTVRTFSLLPFPPSATNICAPLMQRIYDRTNVLFLIFVFYFPWWFIVERLLDIVCRDLAKPIYLGVTRTAARDSGTMIRYWRHVSPWDRITNASPNATSGSFSVIEHCGRTREPRVLVHDHHPIPDRGGMPRIYRYIYTIMPRCVPPLNKVPH